MGEQVGGITASIIYDGTLFAALFGLHYKNETDSKGKHDPVMHSMRRLRNSPRSWWKNSSAGLFVSTDGGKNVGYGWESDDTAVRTAILLEQTLKELDDRYKSHGALRSCRRNRMSAAKTATSSLPSFRNTRSAVRNRQKLS
ncbi:MAG: hypothetical protein ACLSCD_04870 [Subdoligranulum sp.]